MLTAPEEATKHRTNPSAGKNKRKIKRRISKISVPVLIYRKGIKGLLRRGVVIIL